MIFHNLFINERSTDMIICLAGPSSTGKTTLFNELNNHKDLISAICNQEIIFKEEYVRTVIENSDKSIEEIINNPESAINFQCQLSEIVYDTYVEMLQNKSKLYICDRSPLDTVVYTLMNYATDNSDIMIKYRDKLSNACSTMRSIYSYVDRVYLTQVDRINNSLVERDGFRPTAYEYRRQLEIELFNTIFDFSNKVVKLPSNQNDRVNTVLTDLSNFMKKS